MSDARFLIARESFVIECGDYDFSGDGLELRWYEYDKLVWAFVLVEWLT